MNMKRAAIAVAVIAVIGLAFAGCKSTPKAGANLENADQLYWAGSYDEALDAYNKAIADNGGTWAAYNNRGITYAALGKYTEALADINQALKLNPKSASALNNRGNIHFRLQDHDAAIADYDQALGLDPNNETVKKNRDLVAQAKSGAAAAPAAAPAQ